MSSFTRLVLGSAFAIVLAACHAEATAKPPSSAKCDVETVGRTAGSAAKTGAVAAADGVVQVGSATAGLVTDGASGAKEKWKSRGAETKQDARENADETSREANRSICK